MESTIKLFKAVPITKNKSPKTIVNPQELLKETLKNGFILSKEVIENYSPDELRGIINKINKVFGVNGEKLNQTFHKSWAKVKNTPIEQLVLEQITHYITTYGFEALGIYDQNNVYIPSEKLNIPKLKVKEFNFVVIKGYTKQELKEKLLILLSGMALKEETVKLVMDVAIYLQFGYNEINLIKNKEIKATLYDYLHLIPREPVEFLRYLLFKTTGSTLIIKNPGTIQKIKEYKGYDIIKILQQYKKDNGLEKLAEVFFRFKPLWLAFRSNNNIKPYINRIRKLADTNHKPLPEDYLNSITKRIKTGQKLSNKILNKELSNVNIFRKIRVANAIKYRMNDPKAILYQIRNGKGYAQQFTNKFPIFKSISYLKPIIKSIGSDLQKNLQGKKVYIPDNIIYALPTTEKQFIDMIPYGTYLQIPNDMIFGVHWENLGEKRVDLDLALLSVNEKFGWDGNYRGNNGGILFSGDITDAPKGASEAFYIKNIIKKQYCILTLNFYNAYSLGNKNIGVPFKLFVGSDKIVKFDKNYMVDPNKVVMITNNIIGIASKTIGLISVNGEDSRFYFFDTSTDKKISSRNTNLTDYTREYMIKSFENKLTLNEVLTELNVLTIDRDKADIDLSPEKLEKDTFINLMTIK